MKVKNTKIRIKDIAERAGISVGTVDRVLHNRGEVKEDTRKKVMQIVDELGYTPNLLAKSLASKKIYKLAVLMPGTDDNNPYWNKPVRGIDKAQKELKDYNAQIDIFIFNATDEHSFYSEAQKVISYEPDGIVFNPVFKESSHSFSLELDKLEIPYAYFDIDLGKGNNLAYFGQNAEQSGVVSAKLAEKILSNNSAVLILKLANNRVISHHLNSRERGFIKYLERCSNKQVNIISKEIDLLKEGELDESFSDILMNVQDLKAVYVPSSRVFKVAEIMEKYNSQDLLLVGYDLIEENLSYLKNGAIDFLISQKPEEQSYKGVIALFWHLVTKTKVDKINHSAIDIIIKENLDYYNV